MPRFALFLFAVLTAVAPIARGHAVAGAAQAALTPEARDYFDRLDTAGSGPGPNAAPISHLVAGLRARGLWDKLKAACLLAGPDSLSGALVPLRADMPTPTNFNFVAGDYSRATGLKGDGVSKYLLLGISGIALAQNSAHVSAYVTEAHPAGAAGCYIGNSQLVPQPGAIGIVRSGVTPTNMVTQIHGDLVVRAGAGTATGLLGLARAAADGYAIRLGPYVATVTDASSPPLARDITCYRLYAEESGYCAGRQAWVSAGTALNLAQLDALLTTYVGSLQ